MPYLISIDPETKEYKARIANTSSPIGRGGSLYHAIEDLDKKLQSKQSQILVHRPPVQVITVVEG